MNACCLCAVFVFRAAEQKMDGEVDKRLIMRLHQLRNILEKIRPLDSKLDYQI